MFLSFRKDGRVTLVKRRPKSGCGCGTLLLILLLVMVMPRACMPDHKITEPQETTATEPPVKPKKAKKRKAAKAKEPAPAPVPPPFRVGQVVSMKEPQPVFHLPGPIFVYQAYMDHGRDASAAEMIADLRRKGQCVIINEHWELEVLEVMDAKPWVVRFRALNAKAEWWAAADWLQATE